MKTCKNFGFPSHPLFFLFRQSLLFCEFIFQSKEFVDIMFNDVGVEVLVVSGLIENGAKPEQLPQAALNMVIDLGPNSSNNPII